jgi:hypothetical protein
MTIHSFDFAAVEIETERPSPPANPVDPVKSLLAE